MTSYFLAAVLALTLVALSVLRARSVTMKITGEILLLGLLTACLLWGGTSPLPSHVSPMREPDAAWLRAIAVIWWLIGARLIATVSILALGRDARSREARLVSDLLAGAVYVTAVLIILNSVLDLRVNGLLATSGVLAIVLGLALQNTLADVFSGVAVGIEQPFHVGDRVSIGDHPEGVVVQMNWRSIRIRTDGDDLATIPNSIVARSEIINRSVPTERRAASVEIPTQSTARSETLIELLRQAVLLSPGILEEPAASIAIRHIGTRSTTLGISYFVTSTAGLSTAKGELLRQVRRLFRHANVHNDPPETRADLLTALILFESLTRDQIEYLAKALIPYSYDAGGLLFAQGSHGASLYVIRSGVFEVTRDDGAGHRKIYGRIGPGEYLGEISMMSGAARSVTVTALASGEVLELPRTAIETLLGEDHALSTALERSMQRGLALLDRDSAARMCQPLDEDGTLLGRIRGFLHRRPT